MVIAGRAGQKSVRLRETVAGQRNKSHDALAKHPPDLDILILNGLRNKSTPKGNWSGGSRNSAELRVAVLFA